MFAGFNLETDHTFAEFHERGEQIFVDSKEQVKKDLEFFTDSDSSIDGTRLQTNWFPQIEADIFISHSHKDARQAIGLAGWLNHTFGLRVFIDSCVWGYAGNLLKIIDDKYCRDENGDSYNYHKRNYSTSHVHIILSTALSMMMDKTECILLLNTPNSISSTSEIINKTESSWIYHELAMTNLVRKKNLIVYRQGALAKALFNAKAKSPLTIKYNVSLEHLQDLTHDDLVLWQESQQGHSEEYPLDVLYTMKAMIENES